MTDVERHGSVYFLDDLDDCPEPWRSELKHRYDEIERLRDEIERLRDIAANMQQALYLAAGRFEWLQMADDTERHGVKPSIGAVEARLAADELARPRPPPTGDEG